MPATGDGRTPQIWRVPFMGPHGDPDRPPRNTSFYELAAFAGLDHRDAVVVGRAALALDLNFSVKTAAITRALPHSQNILDKLPRGEDLLDALNRKVLTAEVLDDIVQKHLRLLKSMAYAFATRQELQITHVVVAIAAYLRPREDNDDHAQYVDWFMPILRTVFGEAVRYDSVSEGQAMGRYICDRFLDSNAGSTRHWIVDLFKKLGNLSNIRVLVVDWGSSGVVRSCLLSQWAPLTVHARTFSCRPCTWTRTRMLKTATPSFSRV